MFFLHLSDFTLFLEGNIVQEEKFNSL